MYSLLENEGDIGGFPLRKRGIEGDLVE